MPKQAPAPQQQQQQPPQPQQKQQQPTWPTHSQRVRQMLSQTAEAGEDPRARLAMCEELSEDQLNTLCRRDKVHGLTWINCGGLVGEEKEAKIRLHFRHRPSTTKHGVSRDMTGW
eukprot:1384762-Amphidinium_carterae.1